MFHVIFQCCHITQILFYFRLERNADEEIPPAEIKFKIQIETDLNKVYKHIQEALQKYKDKKVGPTLLAVQSVDELHSLQAKISHFNDFPQVQVHVQVSAMFV